MDKKIHKITNKMKMAEKDIKGKKFKEAKKILHSAEKKNEKLKVIDRDIRDPKIEIFNKIKKLVK